MELNDSTLLKIKQNKTLKRALEDLHNVSDHTVKMWLIGNKPPLVFYSSLLVIAHYLKTNVDNLITGSVMKFLNR